MDKKEGTREFSSSKEREKLKQRLQTLFKQHELKQNKEEAKKSSRKHKDMPEQQVGGQTEVHKETKNKNVNKTKKNKAANNPKPNFTETKTSAKEKPANRGVGDGLNNSSGPVEAKKTKKFAKKLSKNQPQKKEFPSPTTDHTGSENGLSNSSKSVGANKSKKVLGKMSKKQKQGQKEISLSSNAKQKFPNVSESNRKGSDVPPSAVSNEKQHTGDGFDTQTLKTQKMPKEEVPLTNGQRKLSKNQKKKAKKRAAATLFSQETHKDFKKPKLTTSESSETETAAKTIKKSKHKPKKRKHHNKSTAPNITVGKVDGDYDFNNISGFVKGGDFDSDDVHEEDTYWMQQDKDLYNDDPEAYYANEENMPDDDNGDDIYNSSHIDDEDDPYDYSDYNDDGGDEEDDDPYNYSDLDETELDNNDPYDYSDYVEEEEEEEEHYSDFDEDDYEEDEDSYDYSDSEFSSNFEEEQDTDAEETLDFNDEEDDEDYKLPDDVPEDLIIHSGTATKRDIQPDDNVVFKDKKYCQIIELAEQDTVKVVQQPKAYDKEELIKLTYKENHTVKIISANNESEESISRTVKEDDCPKLVPIVDEDGFELYNPNEDEEGYAYDEYESIALNSDDDEYSQMGSESLGSEYTEINSDDADSFLSEDINDKYMNRIDNDYYSSDEEHLVTRKSVDIIDATNCDYTKKQKLMETTEESWSDEDVNQLPSMRLFQNVKVGNKSKIVITTIIDQQEQQDSKESKANKEETTDEQLIQSQDKLNDTSIMDTNEESSPDRLNEIEESKLSQSSGQHEAEKQTKLSSTRSKLKVQNLKDYNTIFCNAINANLVLILLKDPFYIYGTVRLTLLAGHVEVYGHPLSLNEEVELFSPRGCSVIEISAKSCEEDKTCSKGTLKSILKGYKPNFILADLEKIADAYEEGKDAVVLMKRNEGRRKIVQQFKKFMNENIFPNLQNISIGRPLYNTEYLLRCLINTSATELKCLHLPDQWQLLTVSQKSRLMLAGGKGVGKSTLLRYIINKHIMQHEQGMLVIDLDIGQPEIFIPQTVSCSIVRKPLLGPGFFLNIQPEKAYAVGHTNIALCPHKYVSAVLNLIRYCLSREDFKDIPWLINTMGYNKGFGMELISLIIKALPLTDLIQLQSKKNVNNFDSLLFPHTISQIPSNMFVEDNIERQIFNPSYRLHVWQSAVLQESRYQKEWDMSPKDMRYAMLLTRLSEALHGHSEWLTDCKPLSAPLDQLKLVNLMDDSPPCSEDELAKAMEANLVYLCHYENDQSSIECFGIGVVRAIDYHVRQVYLLPAMATSILKDVNCLAICDMPLPNSIFTNQGSRVKNFAPFVYNTVEAKASKAVKQIYHRPRAFLTGKHKSLD